MITAIIGIVFIFLGACLVEFAALLFDWHARRKERKKRGKDHEEKEKEDDVLFDFIDLTDRAGDSDDRDRGIQYIPVRQDARKDRQKN